MTEENKIYSIKIIPNWTSGKNLLETWKQSGQKMGQNLKLLDLDEKNKEETPDYWVIINHPGDVKVTPEMAHKTIIFYMEPRRDAEKGNHGRKSWGKWANPDPAKFLQVRDFHYYPNNSEWFLRSLGGDIVKENADMICTAVVTSKNFDAGHILRLKFLHYAEKVYPNLFRIWGQCETENFSNYMGELPFYQKDAALISYKYTFAAENTSETNYFTEKIIDAIMTESLCFYW